MYQFSKHGIKDKCYAVFGYKGDKPSQYIVDLAKKYNIFWYKDERDWSSPHQYVPLVRPHILKKFFKDHPELGKSVFYHDSDIFLVKLPDFESMLSDNYAYVSDTTGYISYDYIASCATRYKNGHPTLPDNDIFTKMCECAGISEQLVKDNNANAGGAQYLLKNIDADYWAEVETVTNNLYTMLKTYESTYPIQHHIQSWTADMWGVLWVYLKRGEVRLHPSLEFSWATDDVARYYKLNIFHLAGITEENCKDKFFKGNHRNKNIFREYAENKAIFDHVSPQSATYEYVRVIKEYCDGLPPVKQATRFLMKGNNYDDVYVLDTQTRYQNSPVWRSMNKQYIIFHSSTSWILTHTQYESEISPSCGGFAVNSAQYPYEDGWNISVSCELI
jgi:hypothetical protein